MLSTFLALVKLWEMWRARRRIEIGCIFGRNAEIGNTIRIRNLSGTPFTITYWVLEFRKPHWFWWKTYRVEELLDDASDIFVDSYKNEELRFSGGSWFSCGKYLNGKRLRMKLYIAGTNSPKYITFYKSEND